MAELFQDFRFAIRTLRKNPGYATVALLTLMLGIGANAAIFSLVNSVLLRPLPYPDPDRLVRVWELNASGDHMQGAWRNFVDWRESSESFSGLAAHASGGVSTVLGTGVPLRVGVTSVSEGFLRTLGAVPAQGRDFLADEHRLGADPAAIVSDGFWRTYLGADPELTNHRLEAGGFDARIVGVTPPGFAYPDGVDVWYPLELNRQTESRSAHNYVVVGRLRDGVSPEGAEAELDVITARFLDENPSVAEETWFEGFFPRDTAIELLHADLAGASRRPLLILLGASTLLLLVACTNLASAALARGTGRERQIAVRRALGAGRRRVLRLLLAESFLLSIVGSLVGLALAAAILAGLPALAPDALPPFASLGLDPLVLVFTLVLACLTTVLFGLFPALGFTRGGMLSALKAGSRAGTGRARTILWRSLVASEVALALVLLVGCGLLVRSFLTVLAVEPGFQTRDVLLATLNPPATRYQDGEARVPFYEAVQSELEALPGVASVGLVAVPPMSGLSNGIVDVEGGPRPAVTGDYQLVSPGFFGAMEIPVLAGRTFDTGDRPGTEHVVMVNQAFADLAWAGEDPIGKRMTAGGMDDYYDQQKWATVVGLVADIRQRDLARPPSPTYYFPLGQRPFRSWSMTAVLRPEASIPAGLGPAVRDVVRGIDPDVPVTLATIEARVSRVIAERRFTLLVLGVFGGVALLLACIGIYGVVAYAVARRTREIGIRIALGAAPASVRRLVQRDTLIDVAAGAAAGLLLALGLTRLMENLLYEVRPADPLTLLAVVATLGAAAWLSGFIPALRSTRVDPASTMRAE